MRNPENFPEAREHLKALIRFAATQKNPEETLIDLLVSDREQLRKQIAYQIVEPLIGRYEGGLSDEQLETLVWVIEFFVEGPNGEIDLAYPPPDKSRGGLRVV